MQKVVTIGERKARALKRRQDAIASAIEDLRAYALRHGGRFMIFGSVAKDRVREHSDLDVIVDFPPGSLQDAFFFLEDTCLKHGVPYDAQYMLREGSPFLQRIREDMVVLP